jgi:Protein of unknown function (DUF1254)
VTAGYSPDGALAEIFVSNHKAGNASDVAARDAGILISLLLQHGCPIQTIASAGAAPNLRAQTTPDTVESSIGTLQYKDGAPSKETVAKAYDYLDLMHGVEAFVNAYQGASAASIFKGMEDAGVPNNTALIFSELMDAKSLFLTANADTIYFWVNLDVTKGPIVVETPPLALGVVDDMWFQWVTDFGLPVPTEAREANTCLCRPITRASCRAAATTSRRCARPAPPCSGGPFSRRTIRSRSSR